MPATVALTLAIALLVPAGGRPPPEAGPDTVDGPSYPVDRFVLHYFHEDHPGLPPIGDLMQLAVELGWTGEVYVAPRAGIQSVTLRLAEVADRPLELYHATALQRILERVRDDLSDTGLLGVQVGPDPEQIDRFGRDLRAPTETALKLLIMTGIVTEIRTLAAGERIDTAERLNNPLHASIVARSPIQPYREGDPDRLDLLYRDDLDEYLLRLSRHPGRRVEAAISASETAGGFTLDYLVNENKPLSLYAQISNTGTRQTNRIRERFGLLHTQLTGRDDILSLDYTTTAFEKVHAVRASYERPVPGSDRLRWRAYSGFSAYTASEVGVFADVFKGESWTLGLDLVGNIYQDRNLFVDFVVGARYEEIDVDNNVSGLSGQENFLLPHVGLQFERGSQWSSISGSLMAEWNLDPVTPLDPGNLTLLGRLFPDTDWGLLRWNLAATVYLEPLINPDAWADPTTPESSTLAHELALSFRGQYAFDNRLVPQYEQVVGGFYSVRGYPESAVAGDSVVIGSLEYRFHLPRALALQPTPAMLFDKAFRVAPQSVYGPTDWDLVFRGFVDAGRTIISDKLPGIETQETLVGAGVGLELVVRRNLSLRVDWGFALTDAESRGVQAGSNRVHLMASLYF